VTLCDTGPLVAIIDRRDIHHGACVTALPTIPQGGLVTTWPCLTEAMYLLRRAGGSVAQEILWNYVAEGLVGLYEPADGEWERIRSLMQQYKDAPMDFADASLVTAAERLGIERVFTIDRHFRAYRIRGRDPFELIP
jgi:predicted nucleic acid-binding protein